MIDKDVIWCEKYRPKKIDECILTHDLKYTLQEFINQNKIPNLLLYSKTPGTGKTSSAIALCKEIGYDYILINGSDEGRLIDTLRNNITQFCSTVSMNNNRKAVIIDEADNVPGDTQLAFRGAIEKFSKNASFIFTCNYKSKILEPIQSRCSNIDFTISKNERPNIAKEFMLRLQYILKAENIEYSVPVLVQLIQTYFPDFRRTINELQRYSVTGKIDSGILLNSNDENWTEMVSLMKTKDFTKLRQWISSNNNNNYDGTFYRKLYDKIYPHLVKTTVPHAVLILADYQYKSSFVADQELNLTACFVELMSETEMIK